MKVICISDKYITYKKDFICLKDFLTINKIYDVIEDNYHRTADCHFKRVFRIKCDDNFFRAYPEEVLIPINIWRENQLDKILKNVL